MNSRYRAIRYTYLPVFFVLLLPLQVLSAECQSVGQVLSLEGRVEKKMHGREEWLGVQLNENICVGDALRTRHKSRLAVRLVNDTLVRLDADSSLTFTKVSRESPSLLDLIFGAVHFISRTPENLEIRTRYVNAMIEGTEFVVRVREGTAEVTVLEGTVTASNEAGSVELRANQIAHADAGQAPVRVAEVKPDDAVAWALYHPPLPVKPGVADQLAQACVVAIVRNRLEEAAELAQRALAADNSSAAAYMARSYLNQAGFDIPAALDDIERAAELAPQSPLVQARLAEVRMMSGDLRGARRVAEQTLKRNPEYSLLHTVLGFASLREVDLSASEASFTQAIEYDSSSPLPRLGLGLVKIRQGQLESGREEIETAVLLDPNKALLRSYLGKAYYEEKRDSLAFDQLAMAKDLDPNDPTAWYYESILLQSANRPVEALQAQQKAIALNDNRGVYRSRQLLDRDEAARSVSLGRIYNDLNFEQQARSQAVSALMLDPANHSAHRFLADSYAGIAKLDAARRSELLQSKLTQPLNLDPLQPQLSYTNLGLLDGSGPGDLSYNEYNPLFTRNGLALQLDVSLAEKRTRGDDVIVAGLFDNLMFSVGQYHKETDLVAAENGYRQDIANGFVQYQLDEKSSIQLEVSRNEEEKGDVTQRLLPEFLHKDNLQIESEISSVRLGVNRSLASDTTLLLSLIRTDFDFTNIDRTSPFAHTINTQDKEFSLYEAQVVGKLDAHSWLVGLSRQTSISNNSLDVIYLPPYSCPGPSCLFLSSADVFQTRLNGNLNYHVSPR
ncbi:MAG: FecR domain-containing protein, partial [Candidatus Thiodiazotropha sp.]